MKNLIYTLLVSCLFFIFCVYNKEEDKIQINQEECGFCFDNYSSNKDFTIDSMSLTNNYIFRHITSTNGPDNELYTIYSNDNKLVLIAGKCSESITASGYTFDYNSSGSIRNIWDLKGKELDEEKMDLPFDAVDIETWMNSEREKVPTYILNYDNFGKLKKIEGVTVPEGNYDISVFVTEGNDFWISDVSGGDVHIVFYYKHASQDTDDIVKDFVFIDGRIAAEIFYNGKIYLYNERGNSVTIVSHNDFEENILKIIIGKYNLGL